MHFSHYNSFDISQTFRNYLFCLPDYLNDFWKLVFIHDFENIFITFCKPFIWKINLFINFSSRNNNCKPNIEKIESTSEELPFGRWYWSDKYEFKTFLLLYYLFTFSNHLLWVDIIIYFCPEKYIVYSQIFWAEI